MIPKKLSLSNFLCYREGTSLDLSGIHVACLSGDNGHGKSALLDAMTWALWGKARARTEDELVHMGQTEAQVDFEFEADGTRYRVLRKRKRAGTRKRGESMLDFFVDEASEWRTISGNSLGDTEQAIQQVLKMDYDTFVNSAYLAQGRADEFVRRTAAGRKDVLASILGLDQYEVLAGRCKGLAKVAEFEQQQFQQALERIDEGLAHRGELDQNLADVQAALGQTEADVVAQEALVETLRQAAEAAERRAALLRPAEEALEVAVHEVAQHGEKALTSRRRVERDEAVGRQAYGARGRHAGLSERKAAGEGQRELEGVLAEIEALKATNVELSAQIVELERKRVEFEAGVGECPLCGTKLDEGQRVEISAGYGQNIADRMSRLEENMACCDGLQLRAKDLRDAVAKLDADLAEAGERLRQLEQAEAQLEAEKQALAAAEEAESYWQERASQARQEVDRLKAEMAGQPDVGLQLVEARQRLDGLRADERRQRQALGAVEQELDRLRMLEAERVPTLQAFNEAGSRKAIHEELMLAFGKNGVQALIIDGVLPEIACEADRLLGQMTNGRMSLSMSTQRETQQGTVAETLDISISDELGTRSYEMYSGGEAFRINFALRIALSRLLARRAGAPLPTLIIDEGFGSQDSSGRERLVEAIRAIQDDFRCVLVVTHLDELRDAFPVRIEVQKTPEGSTAVVV
jgi:DNA repair exonuclease SbcCD ATPase subunit